MSKCSINKINVYKMIVYSAVGLSQLHSTMKLKKEQKSHKIRLI